jgi:hypothetical protein
MILLQQSLRPLIKDPNDPKKYEDILVDKSEERKVLMQAISAKHLDR